MRSKYTEFSSNVLPMTYSIQAVSLYHRMMSNPKNGARIYKGRYNVEEVFSPIIARQF